MKIKNLCLTYSYPDNILVRMQYEVYFNRKHYHTTRMLEEGGNFFPITHDYKYIIVISTKGKQTHRIRD